MKVAITSAGNHPGARLDKRFGRCSYLVIHDTDTLSTEFIPNPGKNLVESSGPAAAELVASRGVKKVISGEFGIKIKEFFDKQKIQLIVLKNSSLSINELIRLLGNTNT